MSPPVVVGIVVVLYGLSCVRAWNKITRSEHKGTGREGNTQPTTEVE